MRKNTVILFILGAAHSLNHSLFLVLPPILNDVIQDLDSSYQTMGIIATTSFLIYGVGALLGGPLSDYIGRVKLARVSIFLSGASTLIFIVSGDLYTFGTGMFLIALWASFYHPIANSLISKTFAENTAGAMGIHGAVGTMGQIFTPTIAYLLGTLIGWRLAFVFFGLLTMATALAMRGVQVSEDTRAEEAAPLLGILRVPNLWILLLYNVIVGLFFRGIELFFPTFLMMSRGFSGQLAAISNSLILLFGVLGQLLGGRMADAYGSAKVILISSLGVLGSLLMLLMLPLNVTGVILFITLYGSFYFSHQPAMTSLVSVVSPKNLTGMAYGVMFFFSFGLGSFSTTVVGYLADAFNLEIAFWVMTLLSTLALIVSLIIMAKLKK